MTLGSPEVSAMIALFAAFVAAMGAVVSLLSVFITRKNWKDSNRPVVVAYVDEESGGGGITVFNLHLQNTGTRPATAVRLNAHHVDVEKLISKQAPPERRNNIEKVFSEESRVAVLQPGEVLTTSFGLSSTDPSQQWLEYGIEIPIEISYQDIEGHKYRSKLPMRTRPRLGFGGGVWKSTA